MECPVSPRFHHDVYFLPERLGFKQILVIMGYMLVASGLPYQMGEQRPLWDILRRSEDDWEPKIGHETFAELKSKTWIERNPVNDGAWDSLRSILMPGLPVSSEDLRSQLRYILYGIEQISSECLGLLRSPSDSPKPAGRPFGAFASFVLVCASVSVYPNGFSQTLHLSPNEFFLETMANHLNACSLFQGGVHINEPESTLTSLDLLFSKEDDRELRPESRS